MPYLILKRPMLVDPAVNLRRSWLSVRLSQKLARQLSQRAWMPGHLPAPQGQQQARAHQRQHLPKTVASKNLTSMRSERLQQSVSNSSKYCRHEKVDASRVDRRVTQMTLTADVCCKVTIWMCMRRRIDTQAMTGQPSSSGDAAAQVASLIRMFEQQKAKPPQVRSWL